MIITNSKVNMDASRSYQNFEMSHSVTLEEKKQDAVKLDISDEAKSILEQVQEHQKEKEEEQKEKIQENLKESISMMFQKNDSTSKLSQTNGIFSYDSKEDMKLQLLKKLFSSFTKHKAGKYTLFRDTMAVLGKQLDANKGITIGQYGSMDQDTVKAFHNSVSQAPVVNQTQMVRTTVTSGFQVETENTAFQATGIAQTADGRNLSFGVSVEMSRAFCAKYESFSQQSYIQTDPLVINLDHNVASVSDMKFMFDLDADGKEEQISFTDKGSGFLALDKNGDGTINDGAELFGTKSGDGFKDLAKYDEDGNGWIDEADSVFKDLRVWTKDDNGNDKLIDLKKVGVGAIYLGNVDTQFTLDNQDHNDKNAIIQKSGVYLKESGSVGTIQHVDLLI